MSSDVVNNAIKIAKYIVNICNNNEGTRLLNVINFDKFNKYNLNYNIQTEQGYIIEFYYGAPIKIITEYGSIQFSYSSSGNFKNIIDKLTSKLSLSLYRDKKDVYIQKEFMGIEGPWYSINKMPDGNIIPTAKLMLDPKDMHPKTVCEEVWKKQYIKF